MSEAHLKILIDDLSYVASLPIKTTLSTVSYYSNLSEELEKERNLNSLLKAELEEKDEIISILKIRLETERNLYFSQRSELEDKDETIASLIKTNFEKNEELKKAIVESSNYKMILKYANDRNRSLFDGYKILKNEMKEMQDIIDSYICDLISLQFQLLQISLLIQYLHLKNWKKMIYVFQYHLEILNHIYKNQ